MFTLFVSSASVAVEEKEIITAGRVGLQCSIRFSPDWDGLVKTAVFDGAESRDVIVTGERVTIPAECLAAEGDCLKAGFYGKSTDGAVVIPTVWASLGMIEHSVYPSGREGAAPTPDVVAQIQQAAANAEKMARSVREDADLGRLAGPAGSKGEKGDKGDKGDKGADGKSAYAYAVEGGYTGTEEEFTAKLAQEKFANPNALTFTGAVTGSYDGSAPLSVEIPSGGGGSSGNDTIDILMDVTIEEAVAAVTVTLDTPRAYKELYIATCVYGDESNSSANAMFLRVNNTDTMNSKNVIAWIPSVENATSATAKSYGVAFVKLLDDCSFYYCYGSKSANARTPNLAFGEMYTNFNRDTIISTLKFQSVNQWTKFGVGSTIKVYGVRS